MKSNQVVTCAVSGSMLTFGVVGEMGTTFIDVATLDDATRHTALLHGVKQKVSDAAAKSRDAKTGEPITPLQKLEAMKRVVASLVAGQWRVASSMPSEDTILKMALAILYPKQPSEKIGALVDGLSKSQNAAMRARKDVSREIAKITANLGKDVDTDELLDGLKDVE